MKYQVGMIGLGVMGRNILLNMSDHNYTVAGYDLDKSKVEALRTEGQGRKIGTAEAAQEFVDMLESPRVIMVLVPAGPPVDSVITTLVPLLQKGDIIIDAGNSYFKDTDVRIRNLAEKGIHFFGVGVSGGEEGARHGPSIMPGGPKDGYEAIRKVLEAVSAKVNNEPCVTYLGKGSAGHFVKMVHNGIEYGIMQLISECYDLMKRGLGMSNAEMADVFTEWNQGELNGYLMEITGEIFKRSDDKSDKQLIDMISDVAKQKGTGMWTTQSAMSLFVPIPTIDIAVDMRDLSMLEEQRKRASKVLPKAIQKIKTDRATFLKNLKEALYVALITTYAQGMSLLTVASTKLEYGLNLEAVARIWRGGCIIRAALLEDIRVAYQKEPGLPNLLLDPTLAKRVLDREESLRHVISSAIESGVPISGLMTVIGYVDAFRSAWLPLNLIQAQRDFFGSHTYERVDTKGTFHTQWTK